MKMGVTNNKSDGMSSHGYVICHTVLLFIIMAACVNTLPIQKDLSNGRIEDKTHVEPTLGSVIGERQRSIIESFQRLLRQRKLSKDEKQRNNPSPDDMTFQKYFSASPLLRHTIDKLVKDYDRDLNWYRNSKVLKRETLESSPFQEDLRPAGHHSRRSDSAFRSGSRVARRRHGRHYRKKFIEKAERSGWGGGYG